MTRSHPARLPRVRPCRSHAFTLPEMLVVITIVVLLVTLITPSLIRARDHARAIQCAATQRQLSLLQFCYRADNNYLFCHNFMPGPGLLDAALDQYSPASGTVSKSGWVNHTTTYAGRDYMPYYSGWNNVTPTPGAQYAPSVYKYDGLYFCPTQGETRRLRARLTSNFESYSNYLYSSSGHPNYCSYDLNSIVFGTDMQLDGATARGGGLIYWSQNIQNPNTWNLPGGTYKSFTLKTADWGHDNTVPMIFDPNGNTQQDEWGWNQPLGQGWTLAQASDVRNGLCFPSHAGEAPMLMIDGSLTILTSPITNRIGTPSQHREFSYY